MATTAAPRTVLPNLDTLDSAALKTIILAQQEQLLSREQEIEHLKLLLTQLRRMRFGRKSEKLDQRIEQLELKLEELESRKAERAVTAENSVPPGASEGAASSARKLGGRCRRDSVCVDLLGARRVPFIHERPLDEGKSRALPGCHRSSVCGAAILTDCPSPKGRCGAPGVQSSRFRIQGASGPIVLRVVCFLAISWAIHFL